MRRLSPVVLLLCLTVGAAAQPRVEAGGTLDTLVAAGGVAAPAEPSHDALAAALADAPPAVRDLYDGAALWPADDLPLLARLAAADGIALTLPRDDGSPARRAARDVAATEAMLGLADKLGGTRADPAALYPGRWFAPRRRADGAALVRRALADDQPVDALRTALGALHPPHDGYRRLRRRAQAIRAALAAEAARPLPAAGAGGIPSLASSDRLREAAALDRIELNLERWRWLPRELGEQHIWVNVPAFELAVREGAAGATRDRLRMPATVGQTDEHWQTPVLSDRIVSVQFFPTWTPTLTIQREEILPQARADGGAELDSLGFFVERRGRRLNPREIDWERARAGQYRIVQRGGPLGRLGRVKFVMPNRHYILIHDTTSPDEFDADRRAFSHGCVRAGDVEALADEVLGLANGWEPGRASGLLRGAPRSRGVSLRKRLPVHIVYLTAEVDADGALVLHDDLYGFDAPLANALTSAQ